MPAVTVQGTEQFRALARRMKEAGATGLRREMTKSLRAGAQPLVDHARKNVLALDIAGVRATRSGRWRKQRDAGQRRTMRAGASARQVRAEFVLRNRRKPSERLKTKAHKGSGLRASVARTVSAKVSAAAGSSSLRVRAERAKMPPSQRKLPNHLNTGRWRHPTFGREPWVTQTAPPGWFNRAMETTGPEVRDKAIAVIGNYIESLE